ncbi:MAG TPA: hypothetical protein VE781_08195 [Kineosporiaceae bacterium]|nr:hypothetical protein [Kineosporiaceae bacterium]
MTLVARRAGTDGLAAVEALRVEVHRASFDGSTLTAERWSAMGSGAPYADARCLLAPTTRTTMRWPASTSCRMSRTSSG